MKSVFVLCLASSFFLQMFGMHAMFDREFEGPAGETVVTAPCYPETVLDTIKQWDVNAVADDLLQKSGNHKKSVKVVPYEHVTYATVVTKKCKKKSIPCAGVALGRKRRSIRKIGLQK